MNIKRYIPLIIIAAGFVLFFALGLHRYLSFSTLADHREDLLNLVDNHFILTALAFIIIYAISTALSVPGGTILTLAGGFMFGTWLGGTLVVLGATLGATAVFLAARTAFGKAFKKKGGKTLQKLSQKFEEDAISYLLFVRLVPLFPFWLINIAPAFSGVKLHSYVWTTFIGIMPGTFIYASVGNGMGAILDRGENPDLGIIFAPEVLLPILALAVLSLVPVLYKKIKGKPDVQKSH